MKSKRISRTMTLLANLQPPYEPSIVLHGASLFHKLHLDRYDIALPKYDDLTENEWAPVWDNVIAASKGKLSDREARVRGLVNEAALLSGCFAGFREFRLSRAIRRRSADKKRRILKKAQNLRCDLDGLFGGPISDSENCDPWKDYRHMLADLDALAAYLDRAIESQEDFGVSTRNPANAAKLELDRWRARLVLVWQNECGLPVHNSKHLRGFLNASMRPRMPRAELTDRIAKHFIEKWLTGKVKMPPPVPHWMKEIIRNS